MTDGRTEDEIPAPDAPPPAAELGAPVGAGRFRRVAPWLAGLIVVALIAASLPYWAPRLPWGGADHALQQGLTAAEAARQRNDARIAALEAQTPQLQAAARDAASAAALAALAARVAALEQRQAADAAGAASVASIHDALGTLTARLDADEARLGKLAAQSSNEGDDRMLLVALAELRAALTDSGPFTGELATVTAAGHGDSDLAPALQPLASSAATGIPNIALLAERFHTETAPAIFAADEAAAPAPGASWGARILARIRALVIIHRIDGGDPTDTDVATAERALAQGNLAAAVAAVTALSGAPAKAAASWLALAKERLAAEDALAKLSHQLATRVAGAGH